MKLIFLGAPGAGKGTQAGLVGKKLGIPTISTGEILRAAVKAETPVGLKAKSFMDAGKLVPDDVILDIVMERLAQPDCRGGYILDGVPRTIAQAEYLDREGIRFDAAISLEISDAEITARMTGRRSCPQCGAVFHLVSDPPEKENTCDECGETLVQRTDDSAEIVQRRLEVYHAETEPLKAFYKARGVLRPVENLEGIAETNARVMKVLELECV
ncbi:MAG: adenylate kinase [Oscillospiraceae bacterium]|nr:adenylate kinase [Oscillospiraceae bacterium]